MFKSSGGLSIAVLATVVLGACATASSDPFDAAHLAAAIQRKPVVLLGEVHDNAAQHAVRAQALRRVLEGGARPALAFEQFDREQQAAIDRARREPPPAGTTAADHVIAQAGQRGWDWDLYRPYVALALEFDLPIVAANLSRPDASRVARAGVGAVFDEATIAALGLERLPPAFLRAHEQAVDDGHCNMLPSTVTPTLARAQIARDAALAQALRPYADRGVILLTGNGHARNDVGVPFFLTAAERARTLTIGLLESETATPEIAARFDAAFITPTQQRPDPCEKLRGHPRLAPG